MLPGPLKAGHLHPALLAAREVRLDGLALPGVEFIVEVSNELLFVTHGHPTRAISRRWRPALPPNILSTPACASCFRSTPSP